jgi:hypothetical protein
MSSSKAIVLVCGVNVTVPSWGPQSKKVQS